jgi:hypothetical protein
MVSLLFDPNSLGLNSLFVVPAGSKREKDRRENGKRGNFMVFFRILRFIMLFLAQRIRKSSLDAIFL